MKDYFSGHAKLYAAFRPTYPKKLYQFIFQHVQNFEIAWDCATGNGQVAQALATKFDQVKATDISQQQVENAIQLPNITYSIAPAEKTNFANQTFDLITVGQAIHWFNLSEFYKEVYRIAKPNAVIAIWGYNILSINKPIDAIIQNFYRNIVGPYWDDARKLVDDEYRSIDFPFDEIEAPEFDMKFKWTIDHLAGYLTTWSATQNFMRANDINPVGPVILQIKKHWSSNEMEVTFPLFIRLGKPQL